MGGTWVFPSFCNKSTVPLSDTQCFNSVLTFCTTCPENWSRPCIFLMCHLWWWRHFVKWWTAVLTASVGEVWVRKRRSERKLTSSYLWLCLITPTDCCYLSLYSGSHSAQLAGGQMHRDARSCWEKPDSWAALVLGSAEQNSRGSNEGSGRYGTPSSARSFPFSRCVHWM